MTAGAPNTSAAFDKAATAAQRLLLGTLAEGAGASGDGALRATARQFMLCRLLAERPGAEGGGSGGGPAGNEDAALLVACRQAATELARVSVGTVGYAMDPGQFLCTLKSVNP